MLVIIIQQYLGQLLVLLLSALFVLPVLFSLTERCVCVSLSSNKQPIGCEAYLA